MTQNQLQNAANIEAQRHNLAVEDENSRHNVETERLEGEKNVINERWNSFQEDYLTRQQNWKESYDSKYLEFQTANEERKRELESEMNDINRMQAEAEAEFKRKQGEYYDSMAIIEGQRATEQTRHNEATEGIQYLEWQTQNKWVEYQNYANLENIGLKREEVNLRWAEYEKTVEHNRTMEEIESTKNFLRKEELDWNKQYQEHLLMNQDLSLTLEAGRNKTQASEAKANNFRNYALGINSYADTAIGVFNLFQPTFANKSKGIDLSKGVKYGKEIAEALLFK